MEINLKVSSLLSLEFEGKSRKVGQEGGGKFFSPKKFVPPSLFTFKVIKKLYQLACEDRNYIYVYILEIHSIYFKYTHV